MQTGQKRSNLTRFEKNQPPRVFIEAGRKAFGMIIYQSSNPYKTEPYFKLWDKGYMAAKREFDNKGRPYAGRPVQGRPKYRKTNES